MITLGVDLSTDPKRTALAWIDWREMPAIRKLVLGATDDELVDSAREADAVAIDAPFGWPRAWAEAVSVHRPGAPFRAEGRSSHLTSRATDRWVEQYAGVRPLAVGANLIGATAIRCARVVNGIGYAVDVGQRLPPPFVCEAYPAAALRCWGISYRLYKGKAVHAARVVLLDELITAGLPIPLGINVRPLMEASDDVLDAVVCSLIARCTAVGQAVDAPTEMADLAASEGWIRLPRRGTTLASLTAEP